MYFIYFTYNLFILHIILNIPARSGCNTFSHKILLSLWNRLKAWKLIFYSCLWIYIIFLLIFLIKDLQREREIHIARGFTRFRADFLEAQGICAIMHHWRLHFESARKRWWRVAKGKKLKGLRTMLFPGVTLFPHYPLAFLDEMYKPDVCSLLVHERM